MIEVKGINKQFSAVRVLNNVSFTVEKEDIFGIVGYSGAGKSTLLRCINGLESYDDGSIKVFGKEVKELNSGGLRNLRKDIAMIFQNFNLMNRKNVFDNIALPLEVWKIPKEEKKQRILSLIELVGLNDKIYSPVKELSGGQKQRVGIARALALNPKILLCDEATSALDPKTTRAILRLLMEINEKLHLTIVIVTHQMEVIKEVCNKVILLEKGEIKASGKVENLFIKPTEVLKDLMGENELLPVSGVNIKIFFSRDISQNCLITSIARELNVDFSIAWGKLEKFRNDVLGSLVINISEKDKQRIIEYLDSKSVVWEVVNNAD